MDRLQWLEEQVISLTQRVFALEKARSLDRPSLEELLKENARKLAIERQKQAAAASISKEM